MEVNMNRSLKIIGTVYTILMIAAPCFGQVARTRTADTLSEEPPIVPETRRFARYYRKYQYSPEWAFPPVHDKKPDPRNGG